MRQNIPLSLLGWLTGCTVIFSGLFGVGNFLYGRINLTLILLITFVVSGVALIVIINKLWSGSPEDEDNSSPGSPSKTLARQL
jgi:solute:Na+ symporter, SSS family